MGGWKRLLGNLIFMVAAALTPAVYFAARNPADLNGWIIVAAGGAVSLLLAARLAARFRAQSAQVCTVVDRIAQGDLSARIRDTARGELGEIFDQFDNVFDSTLTLVQTYEEREKIQYSIFRLIEEINRFTQCDLSADAETDSHMTGAIADALNLFLAELRNIVGRLQQNGAALHAAVRKGQVPVDSLVKMTEVVSRRITEAAITSRSQERTIVSVSGDMDRALTDLGYGIEKNTAAVEVARRGLEGMHVIRQQVHQTARRLKRLGESSLEIGGVVDMISDISDRTSMLALNASVQDANATESDRSFDYVAEEVERLAQQSMAAAQKIASLIRAMQVDTSEVVTAMDATIREVVAETEFVTQTCEALNDMDGILKRLAARMGSVSHAAAASLPDALALRRSLSETAIASEEVEQQTRQSAAVVRRAAEISGQIGTLAARFRLPEASPQSKTQPHFLAAAANGQE